MKNLSEYGYKTNNRYYTIAEIGINHGGDMEVAKKLIESAARTGVDSVKFQTYITEKRTPKDSPIFDILKKCELPFEAFSELKAFANNLNLEFFSTPFDEESVDLLNEIGCDLYKIASFDVVNHKLLTKVAKTKKPIILSVGMSNLEEIKTAYSILTEQGAPVTLLHCISAYPTAPEDANLGAIEILKKSFDCVIGQSDHTDDIKVPTFAAAMGAQVLEKHFKIDEAMDCIDAPVSITEDQLRQLVQNLKEVDSILGSGQVMLTDAQAPCEQYRRPSSL